MKEMKLELNGKEYSVVIEEFGVSQATIVVDDNRYEVNLKDLGIEEAVESANINFGGSLSMGSVPSSAPAAASVAQSVSVASSPPPSSAPTAAGGDGNAIVAPLPGLIMKVLVHVGDVINSGQNIAIMEAMKMENHVPSTLGGKVKEILVKEGDSVAEGAPLIVLE